MTVMSQVGLLGHCIPGQLSSVGGTDHEKVKQHECRGKDKAVQKKQWPATGNRTQMLCADRAGKPPRDGNIDQGQEHTIGRQYPPVLQRQLNNQHEQQPCQAQRHHDLQNFGELALP